MVVVFRVHGIGGGCFLPQRGQRGRGDDEHAEDLLPAWHKRFVLLRSSSRRRAQHIDKQGTRQGSLLPAWHHWLGMDGDASLRSRGAPSGHPLSDTQRMIYYGYTNR